MNALQTFWQNPEADDNKRNAGSKDTDKSQIIESFTKYRTWEK